MTAAGAGTGFEGFSREELVETTVAVAKTAAPPPSSGSAGVTALGSVHGAQSTGLTLTQHTAVPSTYGELRGKAQLGDLSLKLAALGAEDDSSLEDFACIPEADIMTAMTEMTDDRTIPNALSKGKLIKSVRSLFILMGLPPPGLGASMAAAPAKPFGLGEPPDEAQGIAGKKVAIEGTLALFPPPVPVLVEDCKLLNYRDYVDQSIRGTCAPMSDKELLEARARYEGKVDHQPRDSLTPTAEQLSCLKSLIGNGRPPLCGFWCMEHPRASPGQISGL